MSAARLAARASELLGPVPGPVVIAAPGAARLGVALERRLRAVGAGERPAGAVVVFVGARAEPSLRQRLLRDVQGRLPAGAPLVLVDHNQPRVWWRRLLGAGMLTVRGESPARARYPAARELAALGWTVDRLGLDCGERVQLVRAHHGTAAGPMATDRPAGA